jgi:hypothetical protein
MPAVDGIMPNIEPTRLFLKLIIRKVEKQHFIKREGIHENCKYSVIISGGFNRSS